MSRKDIKRGTEGQSTARKDIDEQKEIVKAGEGAHTLPTFLVYTRHLAAHA